MTSPSTAMAKHARKPSRQPGQALIAVREAALRRSIPVSQVPELPGILELGNGSALRRFQANMTSNTSNVAMRLAARKPAADAVMRQAGLPAPPGEQVTSIEGALKAADTLGYPIVLKSIRRTKNTPSIADIRNEADLKAAYPAEDEASGPQSRYLQQQLAGNEYLVLVIDHKVNGVLQLISDPGEKDPLWVDVTATIHEHNAKVAVQAVDAIGLDLAEVGFIMPDIAESIWNTDGGLIGVYASSDMLYSRHGHDAFRKRAGQAIVDMLYPRGAPVKIPIVAIAEDGQSSSLCDQVIIALTDTGYQVGSSTSHGATANNLSMIWSPPERSAWPERLLWNCEVDVLVVEVDFSIVKSHGLGFDYADVVVLSQLSGITSGNGEPIESILLDKLAAQGLFLISTHLSSELIALAGAKRRVETIDDNPIHAARQICTELGLDSNSTSATDGS